jgi:hypothetical protein
LNLGILLAPNSVLGLPLVMIKLLAGRAFRSSQLLQQRCLSNNAWISLKDQKKIRLRAHPSRPEGPKMEHSEIDIILSNALKSLYAQEIRTIQIDVGERMICGQLGKILQQYFPDHSVHAEYNRHGIEPKEIEMPNADGEPANARVYPDIIVHQPMHDDANLLVIEVKKSTNALSDASDLAKLEQIKFQLSYSYAAFIRLSTGREADLADVEVTWVL